MVMYIYIHCGVKMIPTKITTHMRIQISIFILMYICMYVNEYVHLYSCWCQDDSTEKNTTHPLSKHVQNMLGKRFEDKARMDNGNENQENATRKGMKIVVRRLPKIEKMKVRRGSWDNFFNFRPM